MNQSDNQMIHPSSLENIVNYQIYRSARILRMKFKRDMEKAGLDITQEQYFILFKLWRKDGQYQAELADDLFNDMPNITRILDKLVRKGLVTRKTDDTDRRKFRIYLTDSGRYLRSVYLEQAPVSRIEDYKDLTIDDLEHLKRILYIIEKNIIGESILTRARV